jgi:hypothetical protein
MFRVEMRRFQRELRAARPLAGSAREYQSPIISCSWPGGLDKREPEKP